MKRYEFIQAHRSCYPVVKMAQFLEVSTSGYYHWLRRKPSAREKKRVALREAIGKRYRFHGGTAGSPLIAADLRGEEGWSHVSRTRVAREMKALGLRCRVRPARKVFTTQSRHGQLVASNQLERCFKVEAPNLVWVSDITYLAVGPKWHYLSVFLDLFSRKVVGWDLRDSLEAEGVLTAFRQAIRTRRPAAGLMVHSDQGVQYTSNDFREIIAKQELVQSMSRKGNCWDNAVAESFFSHLKGRLTEGTTYQNADSLRQDLFVYIDCYYARYRKHSANSWKTPEQAEREFFDELDCHP